MVSTRLDRWPAMSMPASAITRTASGLTDDGADPALCTRVRAPNRARASPSAIWLRAEFATHRNSRPASECMTARLASRAASR